MKKTILITLTLSIGLFLPKTFANHKIINSNFKKVVVANAADLKKAKNINRSKVKNVKKYSVAELLKNIEYDFARSSIRDNYNDKLDQLAELSITNKYALVLRGYADSIGSFKGNWVISDKRATSVKNYLVKKGVPENKIVATPFGSTKPIASNKTPSGRQKNRRVEIKLDETQL